MEALKGNLDFFLNSYYHISYVSPNLELLSHVQQILKSLLGDTIFLLGDTRVLP